MKNFLQVNRALVAEKRHLLFNQSFGTVDSPNQTGKTLTPSDERAMTERKPRGEKEQLSSTCLRSASELPPFRSRYLRYAAMIFAVLVMSIANIGMAWGAEKTYTVQNPAASKRYVQDNIMMTGTTATSKMIANSSQNVFYLQSGNYAPTCVISKAANIKKVVIYGNRDSGSTSQGTAFDLQASTNAIDFSVPTSGFTATKQNNGDPAALGSLSAINMIGNNQSYATTITVTFTSPVMAIRLVGTASVSIKSIAVTYDDAITVDPELCEVHMTSTTAAALTGTGTWTATNIQEGNNYTDASSNTYYYDKSSGTYGKIDLGVGNTFQEGDEIWFEMNGNGLRAPSACGYRLNSSNSTSGAVTIQPTCSIAADMPMFMHYVTKSTDPWVGQQVLWILRYESNDRLYQVTIHRAAGAVKDYTVTAATSTGDNTYGTVSAAASSLDEDETTTITATPAAGYQVTNWAVSGTGASISPDGASNSNTTTLTMGTANATVTATFGLIDYSVSKTLTNCAVKDGSTAIPSTMNYGDDLSTIIEPTTGNLLPGSITVSGVTSYTWNALTGALTLTDVTGNVSITVAAAAPQTGTGTTVTYSLVTSGSTAATYSTGVFTGILSDGTANKNTIVASKVLSGGNGVAVQSDKNTPKSSRTAGITSSTADFNAASSPYAEFTFNVVDGYTFTPTAISVPVLAITNNAYFTAIVTDGSSTWTSATSECTQGAQATINATPSGGSALTGTVHIRVFCHNQATAAKGFRFGTGNVTITGTVAEEVANPYADKYTYHQGIEGSDGTWTITPFTYSGDGDVSYIENFTVPAAGTATHFYVGREGSFYNDNLGNSGAHSRTRRWHGTLGTPADAGSDGAKEFAGMWFSAPIDNGNHAVPVGQAAGAIGTLRINDNSNWDNLRCVFIPGGYKLKFGSTEYAMSVEAGNEYRSEIVEYSSSNARDAVSVGIVDGSGNYVATDNSEGMQHIFLNTGGSSLWSTGSASNFGIYDVTNGNWTSLMVAVPGESYLYEGWVPSNCTTVSFHRLASSTPKWKTNDSDGTNTNVWNSTGDKSLETGKNVFTISGWDNDGGKSGGSWSAYEKKGKFRMNADYTDKNWYVRFYPYNVLTYNANSGTGTMDEQSVACDAVSKTVSVAANGFTAPEGYYFYGWNPNKSQADVGTKNDSYDPSDNVTLSADVTLYAVWKPILVTGITVSPNSKTLDVGGTVTLSATATPSTALDKTVTWSTSDGGVATVTSAGVVTAVAPGTATITATAHDGSGVTGTCSITVNKITPAAYTFSADNTSICSGSDVTFTLAESQEGATYYVTKNSKGGSPIGESKAGTGFALSFTVSSATAGDYYCYTSETTNYKAAKVSSGKVTISHKTATSITTQPTTPVAATVGSACSITGLVAAGTNPTYQWQTCNSDGSSATDITAAGAMSFTNWTTATLGLTPTAAGATYYKCVVSGDCGDPVTSSVVTVNATAAPTLYTVTFNSNGGSAQTSITQESAGASITMPAAPTYASHTFQGWVIGGTTYDPEDPYTPEANVTAYATWKADCAGGGGGGSTTTTLSWFDTSQGSRSSSNYPSSLAKWLYGYSNSAKSSAYAYTITTANTNNKGQGTGDSDYLRFDNGSSIYIYADNTTTSGTPASFNDVTAVSLKIKLTKDAGTSATIDIKVGSTTIADDVDLSEASTSSFKLYEFEADNLDGTIQIIHNKSGDSKYNLYIDDIAITTAGGGGATCHYVTYDGNGADGGSVSDKTAYTSGSNVTVLGNVDSPAAFTKTGYRFTGWNTAANGSGTSYAAGGTISGISGNVTLYAQWSECTAPTASWVAHPGTATIGDGGQTYTISTDATNTVVWTIEDQEGATSATLSSTSGLSTTLSGYTTAGSLYIQAAITGDGIHYLSTPATVLRQRVVISAGCVETTLISATLSSCTGTGAVTGTPGGTSTVAFESCESMDGGYKMGKDGSYMRLALTSGNFAANDEVKITITKASNVGDGALHIYKYAGEAWTELGSVTAAGAGTYSYTLTETNVSTAFNTIGLYRTGKNQNPYVKALSVVRSSCSASKPSSVTVTATPAGPYAIGATPTLTVTATNAETYQWYSNTNNTASDGFLLVGETATTYSPSTAIAGTTYYYCVATNASGSTVSNIITVTVNSAKSTPEVSWTDTDETPNYGGGGYTVKATVSTGAWDGTLTTDMLTASDGVTLSGVSVAGKVITATYGVTETARSPLSFSLTLPETTNYTALAANKEITFDRCGEGEVIETTETPLPVLKSYTYTTASKPNYSWQTAEVGWLTLESGGSSISSTSDSYAGFSYRSSSGKSSITFYSELDAVTAVRVYIKGGGSTTLSKVQKGTTLGKYTQLAPSTDYDYSYSNGSSSIESREQAYIEITFKTSLAANTFVEITLSRNTYYYGVGLITGNSEVGNITTALSWATDPGATVNKKTTDANFRYEAVKASDAASQATLGTISYKSSNTSVATVSATGVVDVLSEGTTTITATLAGSGCYKKATRSYNLVVAEATCTDVAGTITASGEGITIDGNTVTKTDACANVTLTVNGHTGDGAGATYQWYKDGVSMGDGYRAKSATVTANGDYTVEVTNAGDEHCAMPATNTITITGNAISITKIVDEWYVKNGRRTPDIALATIKGTTSWKVNDGSGDIWVVSDGEATTTTGFGECGFILRDSTIYLRGSQDDGNEPTGLSEGNVTLTITAVRDCGGENPNVSITIHKQAANTSKPSIAFIVDGTSGSPVNEVAGTKTSSRPIWVYLSTYFDLTGCNAYWTNNEKQIRQYYSQFDAIVITDDPNTGTGPNSGKKYVNALGTMVDIRPILTMEAFVGKYGAESNWHIGGTPSSPNPRQYELKLQCKDHDIYADLTPGANFRSEEIGGETYYYVTMVDNSVTPYVGVADDKQTEDYPALQGFSAAAIKGTGLLGIGTISDGTLQGGVERQEEPTARMMILGIQHQAMAALTSEGKQIIKNAIEYLLKTNMEDVNDCSSYFIATTDNDWNKASNWSSNKLPDASTKARILAPVTVSTKAHVAQLDIAVSGRSIHYNNGETECSGRVTINPNGALIVEGPVRRTTTGRLFTEEELKPTQIEDMTIGSDAANGNGTLIFDNSEGESQAIVQYYSKANTNEDNVWNWQYMAVPFNDNSSAYRNYYDSYLYRWKEDCSGWEVVPNRGEVYPWVGYTITQEGNKTYTMDGTLVETGEQVFSVPAGKNLVLGNSWTAPIQVKQFTDDDFVNMSKNVYLFNTGYDPNGEGEFVKDDGRRYETGTYVTVPIHASPYTGDSLISSLQAFIVYAKTGEGGGTFTLDYDRHVRPARSTDKVNAGPMHAPKRGGAIDDKPAVLKVWASGSRYDDRLIVLEREDFSTGLDEGWDGNKRVAGKSSPLIFAVTDNGREAVSAIPTMEGTLIGFWAGEDNEYTLHFEYNEEDELYLLDLDNNTYTPVNSSSTYVFTVPDKKAHNRFILTRIAPDPVATGVEETQASEKPEAKAIKFLKDEKVFIFVNGKLYDATGKIVK